MDRGFRCDGAVYPLFVKVVDRDVTSSSSGEGGVCVRVREYWGVQVKRMLKIRTSCYIVTLLFKDGANYLEAYRSLEDCFIKGFHLWTVRGLVSMDFKSVRE